MPAGRTCRAQSTTRSLRASGLTAGRLSQGLAPLLLALGVLMAALTPAQAERRVALVIGNASYVGMPALQNPRNDANDMAAALRDLGFEVMVSTDMKRAEVRDVLAKFSSLAAGADTALVYYAGHALEVRGQYYLVPTDATIEPGINLRYVMMPVADLRDVISSVKGLRLMIFDACRNDPTDGSGALTPEAAREVRRDELQKALAGAEGAKGMVVAYATAPFDVAEDGKSRNSPFTAKLLKGLKEPEVEIRSLFRKVSREVYAETRGRQMPEITLALRGDYVINGAESHDTAWLRIRQSSDPADFREFLARFPLSAHAPKASRRLEMLERTRRLAEEHERAEAERARREAEQRAREAQERRESERRRALCADEAAKVDGLRRMGRRDELERLRALAACPEQTGPQIDAAISAILEQERRRNEEMEAARRADEDRRRREQEAEARRQRDAAEAARKADLERQRQEQEAKLQHQREEAETARKADLERQRQEQEAKLQRDEAEAVRKAELERQQQEQAAAAQRQQAQAERQRRMACEAEAAQIRSAAAGASAKEALSALQTATTCPENAGILARARAGAEDAARATCSREAEQYGAIDRNDMAALSAFAGKAGCPDVAAAARSQILLLQTERDQACARDTQEIDRLRRLGLDGRDDLERLASATTCPGTRPQVVAALGSLAPLPARNTREQIRRAAAALRRIGCLGETGDLPADAVRKGLARYFTARQVDPAPLDFDDALLRRLDGEGDARVCAPTCAADEVERDGKCIPPPSRPAERPAERPAKPAAKPAAAAKPKPPRSDAQRAEPQRHEAAPKPAPPVASSAPPKRSPNIILGN